MCSPGCNDVPYSGSRAGTRLQQQNGAIQYAAALLHYCRLRTPTGEVFLCMPLGALALPLSITPTYLRGTHVQCYILGLRSAYYCTILY